MRLIQLTLKKVGNHWYPEIEHDDPKDLIINKKFERLCNMIDVHKEGVINVYLSENNEIVDDENLIQFSDKSLLRYFTTNDDFIMKFYMNNHQFTISSGLFTLLTQKYKLEFHLLSYSLKIF